MAAAGLCARFRVGPGLSLTVQTSLALDDSERRRAVPRLGGRGERAPRSHGRGLLRAAPAGSATPPLVQSRSPGSEAVRHARVGSERVRDQGQACIREASAG